MTHDSSLTSLAKTVKALVFRDIKVGKKTSQIRIRNKVGEEKPEIEVPERTGLGSNSTVGTQIFLVIL